ncbi:C-8 sterol isomerase [Sporothrix brasiliensis 5110]|uniref:C-8 sterol isomerase n=1 Tax=Sporothrix brasiliensis 5110 TaxID=1398154 RepID=A0A0C2IZD0_9PEZI|nr:C-8 sterol isomerase [Sporothrix brasiliensis 5110]KIH94476.1 C-8 sterol isomerase [Sporothrix brasiliensis 5110]
MKVLAIVVAVLASLVFLIEKNLDSFYIFDTVHLHDLAQRAVAAHGNDTGAIVNFITSELKGHAKLSSYVSDNGEWILNNAGGAMGGMTILHASITEYLIVFGTTVGTEGHTGRHTADDYFHILTGEQWAYVPGLFQREVYGPGEVHHLRRGDVKQYKMPENCFALEYARGWIPPMMFFGFADGFFSTLDLPTLWRTTYVTAVQMIGNLLVGKI